MLPSKVHKHLQLPEAGTFAPQNKYFLYKCWILEATGSQKQSPRDADHIVIWEKAEENNTNADH